MGSIVIFYTTKIIQRSRVALSCVDLVIIHLLSRFSMASFQRADVTVFVINRR